jgi:hypothetical protein
MIPPSHKSPRPDGSRLVLALGLLGLLCIALLWGAQRPVASAAAVAPAVLGFDPQQAELAVGDTFTVAVRINDVVALYGADVRFSFDPQVLQGLSVIAGDAPRPDFTVRRQVDNISGTVWYAATSISPTLPFSGTGTVVSVVFRARTAGTSVFAFTYHKLVQRTGLPCTYTVGPAGQVRVRAVTSTPTPTPSSTATMTPTIAPSRTPTATSTVTATPTRPSGLGSQHLYLPWLKRSAGSHAAQVAGMAPGKVSDED